MGRPRKPEIVPFDSSGYSEGANLASIAQEHRYGIRQAIKGALKALDQAHERLETTPADGIDFVAIMELNEPIVGTDRELFIAAADYELLKSRVLKYYYDRLEELVERARQAHRSENERRSNPDEAPHRRRGKLNPRHR